MRFYVDKPPSQTQCAEGEDTEAAEIVLESSANWYHALAHISWSFAGDPGPGQLAVELPESGIVLLRIWINKTNSAGAFNGQRVFSGKGMSAPVGAEMKIRLTGNADKSLTVQHR